MSQIDYIAQPNSRTTLDALENILRNHEIERIDVAVAYITASGAYDLLKRVSGTLGAAWSCVPKRWLTSFDYCRTEPVALDSLRTVPNSTIRIHDAEFCLRHSGAPKVPFHPKAFLVRTSRRDYALTGSGNMSRSGLARGIEAGLVIGIDRAHTAEPTATAAIQALNHWFFTRWESAAPLNDPLMLSYTDLFESRGNLKAPVPTEDDVASTDTGRRALSTADLRKLRVCRHFWIDAGNVTRNRGPNLPGNQLMMKRLSRVFFGFGSAAIPQNTHIGNVEISFNGGQSAPFSLTYSDNNMDKLVLPIPGAEAPVSYDNEYLLFRRAAPGAFELSLGNRTQRTQWLRHSTAIDGAFRMQSGREWGVF
jgi:HKD family nuclease